MSRKPKCFTNEHVDLIMESDEKPEDNQSYYNLSSGTIMQNHSKPQINMTVALEGYTYTEVCTSIILLCHPLIKAEHNNVCNIKPLWFFGHLKFTRSISLSYFNIMIQTPLSSAWTWLLKLFEGLCASWAQTNPIKERKDLSYNSKTSHSYVSNITCAWCSCIVLRYS